MAMPLQNIAAKVAVFTLQITGVDATVIGTKIHMGNGITSPVRTLNVAEACRGSAIADDVRLGRRRRRVSCRAGRFGKS